MHVSLSLSQIVKQLGGKLDGDSHIEVTKVGSLLLAENGAISFLNDRKYKKQLDDTQASAVILTAEDANLTPLPKIVTDNPYAYFAQVSQLLNPEHIKPAGIDASSHVDVASNIPDSCSVGPNVSIEANVQLGENVVVGAGSVIESGAVIGTGVILEPNVTIKHDVQVGDNCHFFSGCVIGSDGFGYAEATAEGNQAKHWVKIPQVGGVVIKDNVDIGANTTVDRGAIDDTVIEEGVKIDNLVQIAHNCRIGAHTAIAGCVGIAGSAVIGQHCRIGGGAIVLGHLSVADNVTISPASLITRTISKQGTYTAIMPSQKHSDWLKTAANIRHLDKLNDRIKKLENIIDEQLNIKKS